jgi:hypothetical protein
MGTVRVEHTFEVSEKVFWEETFLKEEFNTKLYVEGLKFKGYSVIEDKDDGAKVHRKTRATPKQEAPRAVEKIVGDGSYTETGVYDRATQKYTFEIVPDTMASKTKITGEFWTESAGENRCTRKLKVEIGIKIFGVGKLVEAFVEKTTAQSYEQAAAFTTGWIKTNNL